jgi:antitoxin (DNA-binding transcriptional repressor) of toxin-antitoxin stability system
VARLVALDSRDAPRRGGWAQGEITIGPDFDAPLPEDIQAAFEGRG